MPLTDPSFSSSFLMTFHLFGTAEQLFSLLVARFNLPPPQGLSPEDLNIWTEKKLFPIQTRVSNAIKLWIESYWLEKFDDACLDDIHAFAMGPMMETQPQAAQRILELVSKRVIFPSILILNRLPRTSMDNRRLQR
jgi:son of sevenless-like protein